MHGFFTTSDAAQALGRCAATVRVYEASGRLPSIRTPAGWRLFLRSDVEKLRAELTRPRKARGVRRG
jgi:DNA-binding transcriptional MerR regulator